MQNSFYFLKRLVPELHSKIIGFTVAESFCHQKNEFVLSLMENNQEFHIRTNLYPDFTSLSFPETFHKSRNQFLSVFKELIGLKILNIIQHENDRSFHIELEQEFKLMFKMHGSRSNIILFHKDICIEVLKKNLQADTEINISIPGKSIKQDYQAFLHSECNAKKTFPAFDKTILEYIHKKGIETLSPENQWTLIQQVLTELEKNPFHLLLKNETPFLSLFNSGDIIYSSNSAIDVLNEYYKRFSYTYYLKKEKGEAVSDLEKKKTKCLYYVEVSSQKLLALETATKNEELANIIMANLHNIPKGTENAELFNFYTNQNISIKLKKDLSPQKNAENYYRKSKNQKQETDKLKQNISGKESEASSIQVFIDTIQNFEDIKLLRKYLKENNLISTTTKKERPEEDLFKKFECDGFEILVGKNAKNNDLLTQKYTYKEDLWLHARDVSGSHVVIKYKAGKKFPKNVIERAAQLAAYFSKRKTDTLCPVIFTPKKFVRKSKGSPDGQVIVEKEEVLMVEPKLN